MRKEKIKIKLCRRPREKTILKVDGKIVAWNPKEKEVLFHCLKFLIPQMKYMPLEAIREWLLQAVEFAYERQLHHYRIRRIIFVIKNISNKETMMKFASELILKAENMGTLHGFGIGYKKAKNVKPRFDAEKISVWEITKFFGR